MKPPRTLLVFGIRAIVLFVVLMVVWVQVAKLTPSPAAGVAAAVLNDFGKDWVKSTQNLPEKLVAVTKFQRVVDQTTVAATTVSVAPLHFTYGTVLFISLLLASGSRNLPMRALVGFAILLIPQAFSLVFALLGQIMLSTRMDLLAITMFQADAISAGYTFGMLILPTLAPVALWLCFEYEFCVSLIGAWTGSVEQKP